MDRTKPRATTLCQNNTDQHIKREAWMEESHPGRIHSWPFLPAKREDGEPLGDSSSSRVPQRSSESTELAANCLSRAHAEGHRSHSSGKSTEPRGTPVISPELQDLAPFTGFRPEQPPPLLTSIPQPSSPLGQTLASPGLSPEPHSSISDVYPPPCYDTGLNGTKRYYTLREALELHPNELCGSSKRNIIGSSPKPVTRPYAAFLQEKIGASTEAVNGRGHEHDQPQIHVDSGKFFQDAASPKSHNNQDDNDFNCPPRSSVTKLVRPLDWIHSKLSKRSTKASVQEVSVQPRQPLDSTQSADLVTDHQRSHAIHAPGQSPSPTHQTSRLEHNVTPFSPSSVRRLSITSSFGPSLCESLNEAILDPQSSAGVTPVLNAPASSFSNSNQTLRFIEPEGRLLPPRLRLQTPSPKPHVPPSHCYQSSRSASSPPIFNVLSVGRHPDTRLTLRGGCLPTTGTRPRIDPSHRPADDDTVPPVLWYLAGGRPVLKDRPGQPCYHGQPKTKRRFKNRRGLDEEDISQQRTPNAEPCEPMTYGHLRRWKERSRPADRFDPQTGQMEPVYRPFWQEFAYGISGGRLGKNRPKVGQSYQSSVGRSSDYE